MRRAVIYGAGDVRAEHEPEPRIVDPPTRSSAPPRRACARPTLSPSAAARVWRHQGHDRRDRCRRRLGMCGHRTVNAPGDPFCPSRRFRRFVGVPHDVNITGGQLFGAIVGLRGGPAPVRHFLPRLIDLVLDGRINPGKVFDLYLPLDEFAEAYRAMDERRAIKAFVQP